MKIIVYLLLISFPFLIKAQTGKIATMAPILNSGYYVNFRGDTIYGEIQINPSDKFDIYKQFSFKTKRSKKMKLLNPQKALAYGFDNRHFVKVGVNSYDLHYIERLVTGRINFYELKVNEITNSFSSGVSYYYINDNGASDPALRDPKKISKKFYKKNLKSYMIDKPTIWSSLDKYNFNKRIIIAAMIEFNKSYNQY